MHTSEGGVILEYYSTSSSKNHGASSYKGTYSI